MILSAPSGPSLVPYDAGILNLSAHHLRDNTLVGVLAEESSSPSMARLALITAVAYNQIAAWVRNPAFVARIRSGRRFAIGR